MPTLITDARTLDTLDDRREIWHGLHRLRPRDRFRFLQILCGMSRLPKSNIAPTASWLRMTPRIKAAEHGDEDQDRALTNEIYTDWWALVMQYGLKATAAAPLLEQAVRKGVASLAGLSLPSPAPPSAAARKPGNNRSGPMASMG